MGARIVLLTATELRHRAFRKALALDPRLEVVLACTEDRTAGLRDQISPGEEGRLQAAHLAARERSEHDFFGMLDATAGDGTEVLPLASGAINSATVVERIVATEPDLLVAYGCSIVKAPLLEPFEGRFLNVHLGLSPYYRGAGTNFWPLVEGEPEYVGATFMHIDAGIDTGEVIDQLRARIFPGDTPHQIGNRLIADMIQRYADLIVNFDSLAPVEPLPVPNDSRYYRKADFTPSATARLYEQFAGGLVERHLAEREGRCARVPIRHNPALPPPPA